jgi:flagellar basal body rod protein FlgB
MLNRILGHGTASSMLKEGLTVSSQRVRQVAERVANASSEDFAATLDAAQGGAVDVEREMVTLADEQLRFEAATRLLQKVYAQVRASVRER